MCVYANACDACSPVEGIITCICIRVDARVHVCTRPTCLRFPSKVQQFILSGGIGGTISKSTSTRFYGQRSIYFVAKIYPGHTIPT